MNAAIHKIKRFLQEDQGPTSVEYAVLLGLIATVIIGVVATIGTQVASIYTNSSQKVALVPGSS